MRKKASSKDAIKTLRLEERIAAAKRIMPHLVDHLRYLLALHENNAIIFYSPTLVSQIPVSNAANAFNVFQQGLYQFEIVRLCALWDSADLDKESIPTVIELIDDERIIDALALETESGWVHSDEVLLKMVSDTEVPADLERMRENENQFGRDQGNKARASLLQAITQSRAILASAKYASVMNLRNKHLAHSLSVTNREKAGSVAAMRYGDERDLLALSLPIIEALYGGVSARGFDFSESRKIDRHNAKALWDGCKFSDLE
jgi:hypothetical protein